MAEPGQTNRARDWGLAIGENNPLKTSIHLSLSNGYRADAMTECGDTAGALQLLKDASEQFGEDGTEMRRDTYKDGELVGDIVQY